MAQAIEVDYGDIQGLARFGHGRLKEACYHLIRVTDRDAARDWLRTAPVTTAVTMSPPPDTALQVAFTSQGLVALGVPEVAIAGFSDETAPTAFFIALGVLHLLVTIGTRFKKRDEPSRRRSRGPAREPSPPPA